MKFQTGKFTGETLTSQILKEALNYESDTGVFRRKVESSWRSRVGDVAGTRKANGYICIGLYGRHYLAHRLAWLYVYDHFPALHIDHIDGNPANNAIRNLREATHAENMRNNRAKGYVPMSNGKFRAHIYVNKKLLHLGVFLSSDEARAAYLAATEKYFGEFSVVRSARAIA